MSRGIYVSRDRLLVGEAQDALVEAAACLVEPTQERRAAALVLAGIAMLRIAESDPSDSARERAVELVRWVAGRKA